MYQQIILNSATLSNLNECTFRLNKSITCYGFRVVSVSFMQNYDQFNESNNKILFVESGSPTVLTATIAAGTYDSTSILSAVAAALTAAGTQTYTITYSDTTRRLTIQSTGGKTFKILSGNRGSSSFLQLGLDKANETGYYSQVTLPNAMNLSASQPILLTSRTLDSNGSIYYPAGINSDLNILASITPDNFGDVIQWTNPDDKVFSLDDGASLNVIDFQLVDSSSLRSIKTNSPVVVTLGVFDDRLDLVNLHA